MKKLHLLLLGNRAWKRSIGAALVLGALAKLASACTFVSVSISGSPTGLYGLGQPYSITTSMTTGLPCKALYTAIYSATDPDFGPWNFHGDYGFSGTQQVGTHTFSVANYSYGWFYWKGREVDTQNSVRWTSVRGPYQTV